jgi:hypothetical protein
MDYIGATPQQNPLMGLLAEKLKQAQEFAVRPFGYQNPPAEVLLNLLGVPAVQQTAERIAYGDPLTTGRGMTTKPRPEAVEAAMTVLPAAGLLGSAAERGAMAAGRAGERYAEKVVPQIMERGGLPAQLLGDLSQGSIRPMDVWHGSKSKTITELEPSRSFGDLGVSWVSPDEQFAQRYAGKTGKVYKMDLTEGKNFDFSNKEDIAKLKDAAKEIEYYDPVRGFMTLDKRVPDAGDWKNAEDPRLFNLIKGMGYDSVSVYEDGVKNIGVFNPKKNIKFKESSNEPVGGLLAESAPAQATSLSDIENKFKDVTLDVYEKNGTINLSRIVVPKDMRSSGVGSSVMTDLTSYADQTGQKMALTPSSEFGGNVKRLKDFYKQFGFVENKGKNKDFSTMETMIRLPQEAEKERYMTNLLD